MFEIDFIYDDVLYTHGEGGCSLLGKLLNTRSNTVIGHYHTKAEILFNASRSDLLWIMSVGCGIDIDKYAFAYQEKNTKRPILTCGVVLEGKLPILIPFNY